jgi:hypothetical protein
MMARPALCWMPLALILAAGCGGVDKDIPETAPVSGTVTFKGAPVQGATVSLVPGPGAQNLRPATGTSDAQGRFTVFTYISGADQTEGAMPGDYVVTVAKTSGSAMSPEDMVAATQGGKTKPPEIKNELPEKYASAQSTDLKASVPADGLPDLKLELTE